MRLVLSWTLFTSAWTLLTSALLILSPPCFSADRPPVTAETAKEAYESGRFKEAILCYRQLVETAAPDLKSEWLCRLALAHYRDQDDVAAFSRYVDALDAVIPGEEPEISAAEKEQYDEALSLYLDPSFSSPREMAMKLREKYASVMTDHPDYRMLNFFITTVYANLGMFDQFFDQFFNSYKAHPNCYLAQKIKGVVHIKLFERLNDATARNQQRQQALRHFQRAQELNPHDPNLSKLLIGFSDPNDRTAAIKQQLTHLIQTNVRVPRTDIHYYVQEAIRAELYELAKQFLERAKEWYQFSRVIESAEKLLDRKMASN